MQPRKKYKKSKIHQHSRHLGFLFPREQSSFRLDFAFWGKMYKLITERPGDKKSYFTNYFLESGRNVSSLYTPKTLDMEKNTT